MSSQQILLILFSVFFHGLLPAQVRWNCVDSLFRPLPSSVHVFTTHDSLEGRPNIAFYVKIDLNGNDIVFDADTTLGRGLKPSDYYEKNNRPVVVTNCTFFSPERRNINVVIDQGRMVSFNQTSVFSKSDSLYHYITRSALGIDRHQRADVAWVYSDRRKNRVFEMMEGPLVCSGKIDNPGLKELGRTCISGPGKWKKRWKKVTAVGGGPTLISNGFIRITNEEERMFTGKAIHDRHPRTAMGYTATGELIILSVQGRFPGLAEGATLVQEATILKELGCFEALNLDGGGSSCLLINGKETITPSDRAGQRPVPAVFMVKAIQTD
jgi:hypothetical protein